MSYSTSFMIHVVLALVNLPFVLYEGGNVINLCAMIYCGALALHSFAMAIKTSK